ncbi:hypothetical protein [Xanthomonas arboricola]
MQWVATAIAARAGGGVAGVLINVVANPGAAIGRHGAPAAMTAGIARLITAVMRPI